MGVFLLLLCRRPSPPPLSNNIIASSGGISKAQIRVHRSYQISVSGNNLSVTFVNEAHS